MATIRVPDLVPTPSEDCEKLKKAFEGYNWLGWGTDEKAIIRVLGHRNAAQRRKIRETYQQLYQKSLIDELNSELSGDFRYNYVFWGYRCNDVCNCLPMYEANARNAGFMKAVILWTYDPPNRDARLANEALKPKRKDINQLQVIVEIACATSPHHLMAVRQAYRSLFDCSLEEDISANVSLPLRKLLVGLVTSYRYDRPVVDLNMAEAEAAQLYDAIRRKQLDHDDVVSILSVRNIFQLRETFKWYKQKYGNSIDQDILKCGLGIWESILKVVVWCIDAPEKHFAEVIRAAVDCFGTDEDSLTRAIVTRAEIDMMKVRGEYFNMNNTSLDKAVIGDTSGDYKDFLMTLLGAGI